MEIIVNIILAVVLKIKDKFNDFDSEMNLAIVFCKIIFLKMAAFNGVD